MTMPVLSPHGRLLSRVTAAVFGGYALASATAYALAALLPIPTAEATLVGMQLSFVAYTTAVIWVFAVQGLWRAWLGLLLPAAGLAAAALLWSRWAG